MKDEGGASPPLNSRCIFWFPLAKIVAYSRGFQGHRWWKPEPWCHKLLKQNTEAIPLQPCGFGFIYSIIPWYYCSLQGKFHEFQAESRMLWIRLDPGISDLVHEGCLSLLVSMLFEVAGSPQFSWNGSSRWLSQWGKSWFPTLLIKVLRSRRSGVLALSVRLKSLWPNNLRYHGRSMDVTFMMFFVPRWYGSETLKAVVRYMTLWRSVRVPSGRLRFVISLQSLRVLSGSWVQALGFDSEVMRCFWVRLAKEWMVSRGQV